MSRKWISFPRVEGQASRQAHTDLPEGTYEREMGKEGFFGPSTQFYHTHPPTGWVDWEGPLRPRAFDTVKLTGTADGPWQANPLLSNAATSIRLWRTEGAMDHLARNSDGDDLLFFHEGEGSLYCDFGHMTFSEGDYVMLPRNTTWRIETKGNATVLMVEATNDHYVLPDKGLVGDHAIFDPAVLETPHIDDAFRDQQDENTWQVKVKRHGLISTITYPFNPLDAIGWKGNLMPVRLNWRDIRPLMSHRYHVPPSAHTTFLSGRHVVCTFVPRPFETDPGALKVPFFHSNDDYDEVIFHHAGDFFSRDNVHPGMMTLHPAGFPHGPQPKSLQNAFKQKKPATDEVAVMIDTRDMLEISEAARSVEFADYVNAWGAAIKQQAAE
jgi:homogentisate 1,2-dioxygenase